MDQAKEQIENLVVLNEKKITLLENLLDITKQQKILISSNSLNALLDNIHKKQEVMDEIDRIDRNFYVDFMKTKEILQISTIDQINAEEYPQVIRLKSTIEMILKILEEIEVLDRENVSDVKSEIEKVKGDMRQVQRHKKVFESYGNIVNTYGTSPQGFYIDGKK